MRDSRFGAWCEVGARTRVAKSVFGDYSHVVNDSDIIYAGIGRFCSIAAHTRINPGNHPLDRVAPNHFTYRSSANGLGEDDATFSTGGAATARDWATRSGLATAPSFCQASQLATARQSAPGRWYRRMFRPSPSRWRAGQGEPLPLSAGNRRGAAALQRIARWDWPQDRLRDALADFRALDATAFCRKYDPA